jgi:hypothetical protein
VAAALLEELRVSASAKREATLPCRSTCVPCQVSKQPGAVVASRGVHGSAGSADTDSVPRWRTTEPRSITSTDVASAFGHLPGGTRVKIGTPTYCVRGSKMCSPSGEVSVRRSSSRVAAFRRAIPRRSASPAVRPTSAISVGKPCRPSARCGLSPASSRDTSPPPDPAAPPPAASPPDRARVAHGDTSSRLATETWTRGRRAGPNGVGISAR